MRLPSFRQYVAERREMFNIVAVDEKAMNLSARPFYVVVIDLRGKERSSDKIDSATVALRDFDHEFKQQLRLRQAKRVELRDKDGNVLKGMNLSDKFVGAKDYAA
jgi:hypothetical protein